MAIDTRDVRQESAQVLLAWGGPAGEGHDDRLDAVLLWLSGGVALLAWTGLALVLTSA